MTAPLTSNGLCLDSLLQPLKIPTEYSYYEKLADAEILSRLEQWKGKTHACLSELQDWVAREGSQLSPREQARVISTVATFDGEGPWIAGGSQDISKGKPVVQTGLPWC